MRSYNWRKVRFKYNDGIMKKLIFGLVLLITGTMSAQRHTMYVTTISGENGGAEIATNVFNSFGERCVPAFNDLQFDVEQDIYVFIADATSLNINGEEYTVLPAQVSVLTNEFFDVHEDGEWYTPALQPTTAVNSRWTIGLSNRLFRSQIRAIEADGWTVNQSVLDGTHTRGDVFFSKEVTVSTGERFRYDAENFGAVYAIRETRVHPPATGDGFAIITNSHLNALMNCAISRW